MRPFGASGRASRYSAASRRSSAATNAAGSSPCGMCPVASSVSTAMSGRSARSASSPPNGTTRSAQPQISPTGIGAAARSSRRSASSAWRTPSPIRRAPSEASSSIRASSGSSRPASATVVPNIAQRALACSTHWWPSARRAWTASSAAAPSAAARPCARGARPAGETRISRCTRSGWRAAAATATAPPREWPTRSNSGRSSASTSASATSSSSKPGPAGSDSPKPGTSTVTTLRPDAESGPVTCRQISRLVATPCSSTSGSPSPCSSRPRAMRYLPLAQRRVVRHELAVVRLAGELDGDDAPGLDARDHALAERGVDDVVADAEHRGALRHTAQLLARLGRRGRRGRPRGDAAGARGAPDSHRVAVGLVGELARDLVDEARPQAVGLAAEDVALARVGQVEVAHRAGDADVGQPPLLLQPALVERPVVREQPVLAADDEHDREFEALGVVERHERHEALVVADRVRVREQRDLLEERLRAALLAAAGLGVELARDADELLEVLDPPLRLDRPLGLERVDVAGLAQGLLEQLADRCLLRPLPQALHRRHEPAERLDGRLAERGHGLRVGGHVPRRGADRVRVREHAR